MSFYLFLFVTSLVCFSQARPSAPEEQTPPAASNPSSPLPNPSNATSSQKSDGQKKMDELLIQVRTALALYITPFMVDIHKEDQDILTNLVLDEFTGSVNYMLYIIQELKDPSYYGGPIGRDDNDFIVELDAYNPFPDVPFIEQTDGSSTQ